jgi:hypothetical protein
VIDVKPMPIGDKPKNNLLNLQCQSSTPLTAQIPQQRQACSFSKQNLD